MIEHLLPNYLGLINYEVVINNFALISYHHYAVLVYHFHKCLPCLVSPDPLVAFDFWSVSKIYVEISCEYH